MRHSTFQALRAAYLGNVDSESLLLARTQEKDPFIQRRIEIITNPDSIHVDWKRAPFTTEFRSVPARQRLEEVIYTFLLRIAIIVKDEFYRRTFGKPESSTVMIAWVHLFKQCTYSMLTLLFDVNWTSERMFLLDDAVLQLIHDGHPTALRELFKQLGISLHRQELTEAERRPEQLLFLRVDQFGSFFWRVIHWMAEAINVKRDDPNTRDAISFWKHFAVESMYRLLRCSICMMHLKMLTQELKSQLLDDSVDYAKLWYNIHNRVTSNAMRNISKNDSDVEFYSEEAYQQDSDYMRQALSP